MDACYRFIKYCFYFTNFLIFVGGIALIAIGGITLHDQSYFNNIISDNMYTSASVVVLGSGIFLVLLVSVGTYGAYREIKCLLLMYIVIMLLLFIVLLIGAIIAAVFKSKLSEPLRNEMKRTMRLYSLDDNTKHRWDTIQRSFKCCGIDSPEDWHQNKPYNQIPETCCRKDSTTLTCQGPPSIYNSYQDGCLTKFKAGSSVIGIVGFIVSFFVFLGMCLAYAGFKNIPE